MKKFIILLLAFITACAPASQEPAVVLPQFVEAATPFIDPASYPSAQAELAVPNQTASGFDVRMERASLEG